MDTTLAEPRKRSLGLEPYWLVEPQDWNTRIKHIDALEDPAEAWREITALANTRLDFIRTNRLDRSLRRLFNEAPPPGLTTKPIRLAVIGSSTLNHLAPAIRIAGARRGIWIQIHEGDYGQYFQELSDAGSALHAFRPDALLLALDAYHLLRNIDTAADAEGVNQALEATLGHLRECWRLARSAFKCAVLQQTVLPVFLPLLGANEHRLPGSKHRAVARLNTRLRDAADQDGVDLLAIDDWVNRFGIDAWHDQVLWHRAKQEVTPGSSPLYGDLVGRLLAARQGRAFKCLVLDLDNTLWGGVIGDDGLDGIQLGQGSAAGEAFLALQNYALDQAKRGVILAVCSKNDEANALAPFEKHPDMVLRRKDIACFVANWDDKARNLRSIAQQLNIGIDSLVFVDDNPFERNLVRTELPMVAVPEVSEEPAFMARTVADAGYFEGLVVTDEDRERTAQYQANAGRAALEAEASDLGTYLRNLDMNLVWKRFDRIGLQRTVQLINKTNQFNLTTIRYTEDDVVALLEDPKAFGLQLRLLDRFGDNGIIAIVIGRLTGPDDLLIDTWLMSCRVLGRQVEEATLNLIAAEATRLGAKRLIGEYRPTAKNGMVKEHYSKLGFKAHEQQPETGSRWVRELADFVPAEIIMTITEG